MKVVYVVQNRGIASRTPAGWESAVVTPDSDGRYTPADLEQIASAEVLVVGLFPTTEAMLAAAPRLRLVQRLGVGYDNVDLGAAARRGIAVCNMADFNAATVAEHTLTLMLGLLRRVFESTLLMKGGRWPTHEVIGGGNHDLAGKTIGLVGLGAIGEAVAVRAAAFDVRIVYHDRQRRSAAEEHSMGVEFAGLSDLLAGADIVSLHLPYTPEAHHLIGRAALATMKPTALLINTARGALVDEAALAEALRSGRLAGAGLDVFADEPLPARHPFRNCPNVLLTPHTAGQTREAMERMSAMLQENLLRLGTGQPLKHQVNPV
jgi:phosphoglycerate dehydrogenase-like enzyme